MTLRWISDDPPAIVFAKLMKKPMIQRPLSSPRSGSATAPYAPCSSMPYSQHSLPSSAVAIFMKECSGAELP